MSAEQTLRLSYSYRLPISGSILLHLPAAAFPHRHFIPPLFEPSSSPLPNETDRSVYHIELLSHGKPAAGSIPLYRFGTAIRIDRLGRTLYVQIDENRFEIRQRYLEIAVSIAVSSILASTDCLTLHAASLIHDRHGFLFVGRSGAGKTTLATMAERDGLTVINDELSMIRASRRSGFSLHSPPLWGRDFFSPRIACRDWLSDGFPVQALFFLERRSKPVSRLSPLAPVLAAEQLLHSFFSARFTQQLPNALKNRAFFSLCRLAISLPCHRLSFELDLADTKALLNRAVESPFRSGSGHELEEKEHLAFLFTGQALVLRRSDFSLFRVPRVSLPALQELLFRIGRNRTDLKAV